MSAEADELRLYIDNDEPLYRQKRAAQQTLALKKARGTYDAVRAPKIFEYVAEAGAKKYWREFGAPGTGSKSSGNWHQIFTAEDRREVAHEMAREFESEWANPSEREYFEERLPKKYRPAAKKAPPGPASGFGKEATKTDIRRRIIWETWAAGEQRRLGQNALADAHDLTRVSYEDKLKKHESGSNPKVLTRAWYLKGYKMGEAGTKRHRKYYGQFVTSEVKGLVTSRIGLDRLRASSDPYFNDIPLEEWDRLTHSLPSSVHSMMKEAGDSATLAGGVPVLKEAARQVKGDKRRGFHRSPAAGGIHKAVRYSGDVKITLSFDDARNQYNVSLAAPGKMTARVHVRPPGVLTRAVDSPEEFDETARAALSLFSDEYPDVAEVAELGESGFVVSRRKPGRASRHESGGNPRTSRRLSEGTWKNPLIGERVELHPGTDLWARGARYGEVVNERGGTYFIRMDNKRIRRLVKLPRDRFKKISGAYLEERPNKRMDSDEFLEQVISQLAELGVTREQAMRHDDFIRTAWAVGHSSHSVALDIAKKEHASSRATKHESGQNPRVARNPEAIRVIEAAGMAGGIEEVRRLAKHGWPKNRELEGDSKALRKAIVLEARRALHEAGENPRIRRANPATGGTKRGRKKSAGKRLRARGGTSGKRRKASGGESLDRVERESLKSRMERALGRSR
jgi:hypothetical protein